MDLSKITLAEILSIVSSLSGEEDQNKKNQNNKIAPFIGDYVLVRCRDAGLVFGKLISYEGRSAHLEEARILWRWKCAEGITSADIAKNGLAMDGYSRVSAKAEMILTEDCAIIKCTEKCIYSMAETPDYKV